MGKPQPCTWLRADEACARRCQALRLSARRRSRASALISGVHVACAASASSAAARCRSACADAQELRRRPVTLIGAYGGLSRGSPLRKRAQARRLGGAPGSASCALCGAARHPNNADCTPRFMAHHPTCAFNTDCTGLDSQHVRLCPCQPWLGQPCLRPRGETSVGRACCSRRRRSSTPSAYSRAP